MKSYKMTSGTYPQYVFTEPQSDKSDGITTVLVIGDELYDAPGDDFTRIAPTQWFWRRSDGVWVPDWTKGSMTGPERDSELEDVYKNQYLKDVANEEIYKMLDSGDEK